MNDVGPPPVDRGRIAIYSVLQVFAALFVIFLVPLFFVLILGPISWKVDQQPQPLAPPNDVVAIQRGGALYIQCPSLTDWVEGQQPPACDAAVRWMAFSSLLTAGGSVVAMGLFFFRRARLREKHRRTNWSTSEPQPVTFRLDGMPFWFWVAFAAMAPVTTTAVVGSTIALARGERFSAGGVAFFSWALYEIVWINGVRRAYAVEIEDAHLVWRAPLRSRTIPLSSLLNAGVPARAPSLRPQTVGMLRLDNGDLLPVSLPDEFRRWQFRRLCETLRRRGVAITEGDSNLR